ncbi:MAG: MarR family transcriptional regulator [Acidimicrobiia bacterium]|nr:MarR family transcriptional regulator [Acidimicrobiia bacterium]
METVGVRYDLDSGHVFSSVGTILSNLELPNESIIETLIDMNTRPQHAIPAEDLARFCDALAALHGVLAANLETAAARHDLTPSEARLLAAIDPDNPVPFHQHAERFDLDPSSISLLGKALTEAGLTETRADPSDGRRRHLHLTTKGEAARQRLLEDLRDVPLALESISPTGMARLVAQLERLNPRR